jgi:hypothetical protein
MGKKIVLKGYAVMEEGNNKLIEFYSKLPRSGITSTKNLLIFKGTLRLDKLEQLSTQGKELADLKARLEEGEIEKVISDWIFYDKVIFKNGYVKKEEILNWLKGLTGENVKSREGLAKAISQWVKEGKK